MIETTGNFVAVWSSFEQPDADESGLGVYAQRFMEDGTPDGDAFLVNTVFTEGDQLAADVAVDASGNFVVVWQSQGQDGDGAGIYAQRYLSDGTADGVAFKVNEFTAGDQASPTVAMDNAGNFVIAWQSFGQDGDGFGIYARRYDSAGVALELAEFRVNSTIDGDQTTPTAAAARGNGNFVIAWEGDVLAGEESVEIFARLYESDGDTIRNEFQVNSSTVRDQVMPDVAMDADGDFVVAWTTEGLAGSGADVFARRFDTAGNASGGEFRVNETTLQGQRNPAVAMDGNGDFFVTWQAEQPPGRVQLGNLRAGVCCRRQPPDDGAAGQHVRGRAANESGGRQQLRRRDGRALARSERGPPPRRARTALSVAGRGIQPRRG